MTISGRPGAGQSLVFQSAPKRGGQIEVLVAAGMFCLALAARLFRLGQWSFWPDEVFSFGAKSDGFNDGLLLRSLATDLIKLAVQWLGPSEWSARLVPALIGALSVPLLYLLLRRGLSRPGALMAGALLAISPWHLYWSQNARFYTLLFLFFNAGLLLFYLGLERDRPWMMLASLLLFGLAARERLAALMGMPALVVYLIALPLLGFERPKGLNWRNLLIFFGPALVAGLVMVLPYARNFSGWSTGFGWRNNDPLFLVAGTMYYVGLPLAVFGAGSGLLAVLRKNRLALLLLLTAVLPLLVIMGISLVQYAANRYIFFSLFSWVALGGLGMQMLLEHLPRPAQVAGLVVAAALLAASAGDAFLYFTVQKGNRDDWRSALQFIGERAQPGDSIVIRDMDIVNYYVGEGRLNILTWDAEPPPGTGRVWYVEDMIVAEQFPGQLARVMQSAEPMAEYDVRLPGRTYRMRVYFEEIP